MARYRTAAHEHNRQAWDALVRQGQRFTRPAKDQDLHNPQQTLDGSGWLGGTLTGKQVLCLAAGGGRQSAMYAAAGAEVTVVDISPAMLELDRAVALERRLPIRTVETSMEELDMFTVAQFDMVIQPVSTCYVPEIQPVYNAVARVIKPGGIYISQHKQPASLQADVKSSPRGYELAEPYYREGPLPAVKGSSHREEGTLEYLHRWEELIGGLCRAGFVVEDLIEPRHYEKGAARDSFQHRSGYVAPYVRIKARRVASPAATTGSALWIP